MANSKKMLNSYFFNPVRPEAWGTSHENRPKFSEYQCDFLRKFIIALSFLFERRYFETLERKSLLGEKTLKIDIFMSPKVETYA